MGRALDPSGKRGGDKRTVIMREVVNGLMYILSTGCQWRAIPKDLPPSSTLYDYFDLWSWDGTLDLIDHELYVKCREAVAKEASPTAAVIDSQSVKSAEKRGASIDPPGYDAGKKIKGKKRHILVDTQGVDRCDRSRRRYPGPRWRCTGHGDHVRPVSVLAETLRRWRLSRPGVRYAVRKTGMRERRNRQALGSS